MTRRRALTSKYSAAQWGIEQVVAREEDLFNATRSVVRGTPVGSVNGSTSGRRPDLTGFGQRRRPERSGWSRNFAIPGVLLTRSHQIRTRSERAHGSVVIPDESRGGKWWSMAAAAAGGA